MKTSKEEVLRGCMILFLICGIITQNYQYGGDSGHLSVSSSANTTAPVVHMLPIPSHQFTNRQNNSGRRSSTPILVNNLTGLQKHSPSIQSYMPQKFTFDPKHKIQIDSNPRELSNKVQINPPTQSPLLNGINNMNSAVQMPLNLSMVLGKAIKKRKDAKKRKKRKLRRQRELRKAQEVRNLLGFQKNYPFSNKFYGQAFPKFVPDAMYFNPVSHDIGGLPKLEVDTKSIVYVYILIYRNRGTIWPIYGGKPRYDSGGTKGIIQLSDQLHKFSRVTG